MYIGSGNYNFGVLPPQSGPVSGCGCGKGLGCCGGMGALTMDGSGLFGTGIFGTGVSVTDFSTWSIGEIGAVAVAGLVLFSLVSTGKSAAQGVSKRVRRLRKA